MSSKQRRAELEAEWEAKQASNERERARREALTMWERIEESDASPDVKDILHRMAEHLGLEG